MLSVCHIKLLAQADTTSVTYGYCIPALKGIPIGKGASFEYEKMPNILIETRDNTGNFQDSKNTIKRKSIKKYWIQFNYYQTHKI